MIPKIEEIDRSFTGMWSKAIQLECGTLFINENLSNDLFFNKLTNITCLNEKMIDETVSFFKKYDTRPYAYVLDNPEVEKLLTKKGFTLHDTQHVLKQKSDSNLEPLRVHHVEKKDSLLWTEVFCKSYDCLEWTDEVNSIVRNSVSQIEYLVDSDHNASCVALYEKNSILGLYCLGTIPEYRKKGLGKSLINYALNQVKRKNLDFLMLETYERDNLIEFYSNLGFEKIYEKKIYTI